MSLKLTLTVFGLVAVVMVLLAATTGSMVVRVLATVAAAMFAVAMVRRIRSGQPGPR